MIKKRGSPRIFFGWWTVIGGGLLSFWGTGYYFFGFAALFKPIASELGFSRAVTSVAASIGRLEGGFEAPVVGWITDKFGPRGPVFVGIFIAGLGMMLMYFVNSLWTFYVIWGVVVGAGNNIGLTTPLIKAITDWFVKKRGLALGIRMVFVGSGGMLMLPLIAWLINTQGWRMTCVIGGVVMLLVGLPLAWFCFKPHRPEYYGLLPDGATAKEAVTETSQVIDRGVAYAAEVG
ncbi:MAG: MFS transporter, partial [Dehalococcoidia bacterium]|nr:MFS transporter [Dehalococcoidia bacterium]